MVECVDGPHIGGVFLVSHSSGGCIVRSIIQHVFSFFIRIWTKVCVFVSCFCSPVTYLLQWNGFSIVYAYCSFYQRCFCLRICFSYCYQQVKPVNVFFIIYHLHWPYTRYFFVFTIIYSASVWILGYLPQTLLLICIMSYVIWGFICGQTHTSGVILLRSNDLPSVTMSHYCCVGGVHTFTHTPWGTSLILLHSSTTITQCRGVYHYCCHMNTRCCRYARTILRY